MEDVAAQWVLTAVAASLCMFVLRWKIYKAILNSSSAVTAPNPNDPMPGKLLVVGAGCIGVTVGAVVGLNSPCEVRFLGSRKGPETDQMQSEGITLQFPEGHSRKFKPHRALAGPEDVAAAYQGVDIILVCVKRTANADVARDVAQHAPQGALVCMLQNGLGAASEFKELCKRPDLVITDAVVDFNSVKLGPGQFRWVSSRDHSTVVLDGGAEVVARTRPLASLLAQCGLDSYCDADLHGVKCGKLIVNLVNAPNALSGRTTLDMFTQAGYQVVWRASIREAKAIMRKEGITPRTARDRENALVANLDKVLVFPGWALALYLKAVGRQLDGKASMLQDLEAKRMTEIDYITGYVSAWGKSVGVPTPVSDRLATLVHQAEVKRQGSPMLSPEALAKACNL